MISDDTDSDDSDLNMDQDTSDDNEESLTNESISESSDDEIPVKKLKASASTGIPLVLFNSCINFYKISQKLKWSESLS